jgi:hypothetical protein
MAISFAAPPPNALLGQDLSAAAAANAQTAPVASR